VMRLTFVLSAALAVAAVPAAAQSADERLDALDARITRLEDLNAVERLQKTYGYFVDESQWTRLSELFTEDATLEIGGKGLFLGRGQVLNYMHSAFGPDGVKDNGGALGLRSADRLPDLFVVAVTPLRAGDVAPQLVKSGAGFHVLKLLERRDGGLMVTQTHARHILLRTSEQLPQPAAIARLAEMKQQIVNGQASFTQLARDNSEDGSAAQGGELGWASPGQFVPEFEEAMRRLEPMQVSDPIVSRFGVHLIQVVERRQQPVDRKQQRDIARNVLRERKFDTAYKEWSREVRARAYVEMREPPP